MQKRVRAGLDVGELLAAAENAPPVAAADVVGELLAEALHASEVAFLIADFGGEALIRLSHATRTTTSTLGPEVAERVPIAGSAHGRALGEQALQTEEVGGGWRVLSPVTNRGEAIGVLELFLADEPDAQSVADIALAAHALAYVVIANRRFTDLFEWGQRSVSLSLAAEIQHRLLPAAYTCEAGQFTLAAWLEPAGEIAGDTFDFSLERDTLHLSITDAVGHSLDAAVLATVLVGGLRKGRRTRVGLAAQAREASSALADHFDRSAFVTGQLVRVDLRAGAAQIVNAGHPPPLHLRDGHVSFVDLKPDLPFGLGEHDYQVQQLPLAPGDRLIFLTDGMLERNASSVNIQALVTQDAELHPREAVQHLVQAVLKATGGRLRDDAAVMCFDWHGGAPGLRTSHSGANV